MLFATMLHDFEKRMLAFSASRKSRMVEIEHEQRRVMKEKGKAVSCS
jgi:hypothetical protein